MKRLFDQNLACEEINNYCPCPCPEHGHEHGQLQGPSLPIKRHGQYQVMFEDIESMKRLFALILVILKR
jgi:hypothetical protein